MKRIISTLSILACVGCANMRIAAESNSKSVSDGNSPAAPLDAGLVGAAKHAATQGLPVFLPAGGQLDSAAPLGWSSLGLNDLATLPVASLLPKMNVWGSEIAFLVDSAGGQGIAGVLEVVQQQDDSFSADSLDDASGLSSKAFSLRATDLATSGLSANAYYILSAPALNRVFLAKIDGSNNISATPVIAYQGDKYQVGTWIDAVTLLNFLIPQAQRANGSAPGAGG